MSEELLTDETSAVIPVINTIPSQRITVDFKLPNHNNELSKAQEVLDKLKNRFIVIQTQHSINDCTHVELFDEIVRCLIYVGKLSQVVFDIEDQLEAIYIKQYKCYPATAKELWLQHYDELHHPYTIIKNRCFRLLEALDEEYRNVHHKEPPNINL
jgi:hypothetical protein